MAEKLFHLDRNYLLQEAQRQLKSQLLQGFVVRAIAGYQAIHNPLGLVDDTVVQIKAYKPSLVQLKAFEVFYKKLAAIYRFEHGDNQLEFVWDGRTHQEYYGERWSEFFIHQTNKLFLHTPFLKIVLELTVFSHQLTDNRMLIYRISSVFREQFNYQVYKRKGVRKLRIA
jgi:hypothetical protein